MAPRVVVLSLASDFGCQVQMTNMEDDLLAVLGSIDLAYWQLASSGHLPDEYDVAVIEGAVTTEEHVELLKAVREKASAVIAIGACAITGGIPGLAATGDLEDHIGCVYGPDGRIVACGRITPMPVEGVIDVDYHVPGCPIDPQEFVRVLHRALLQMQDRVPHETMCAGCKISENVCFYDRENGEICLGLVTRAGCLAKCVSLGRPCTGCRGLAADANVASARQIAQDRGLDVELLNERLRLYNNLVEGL